MELLAGRIPTIESWCPSSPAPDGYLHTEMEGKMVEKKTTSAPGNYMGYYVDVLKALKGEKSNPVPAADAVKTMKIIDAAIMSAKEGRVIDL